MRVILASSSPRRQEILRQVGVPFEVFVPTIKEECSLFVDARKTVMYLAGEKARSCRIPGALVIGMDTIVVAGSSKLGKPGDVQEAAKMLRLLSNRPHSVVTGVALAIDNRMIIDCERTRVHFRKLTRAEIRWYTQTGEPFDKAGAYAIQGFGGLFVSKIEGCYYNVVGFPLGCFQRALKKLGYHMFNLMEDGS